MKTNKLDLTTDILKQRISDTYEVLRNEYKGTNPYRQKPVSAKERILTFSQFTPEMIQQARMSMGDEAVDNYLTDMNKLIARQRNGTT